MTALDLASGSLPAPGAKAPKAAPDIQIKVSWCKGCGLCVEYCKRDVLEMQDGLPRVLNAEKCSRCLQCEDVCPDFAITVVDATPGADGGRP